MATTLPGSPPAFDRNEVAGTVKRLCSYTRNLQESLDFMLGQIKRDLETQGKQLEAQGESITSMKKTISGLQESVNALGTNYTKLAARVSALEQAAE